MPGTVQGQLGQEPRRGTGEYHVVRAHRPTDAGRHRRSVSAAAAVCALAITVVAVSYSGIHQGSTLAQAWLLVPIGNVGQQQHALLMEKKRQTSQLKLPRAQKGHVFSESTPHLSQVVFCCMVVRGFGDTTLVQECRR